MLPLAMKEGLDIVVEGPLLSRLYYNVTQYYIELLRTLFSGTRSITVNAQNLTTKNWGGSGVFTGYSAGVDSFCTILDHMDGVPSEYKITHLLFNNVGSHGQTKKDHDIFYKRLRRLKENSLGMPLIEVNSNVDQILRSDFQLTHTIRNVATALLFQSTCGKFLYSAAVHYRDSRIGLTHDIGFADAAGVALLSTETTECISSGSQHTRFEKTEIISCSPSTYTMLDVCVRPKLGMVNCSSCWKCLRTELSLEIIESLEKYTDVFDKVEYQRVRTLFIASVLRSKNPLNKEIAEQLSMRGFDVPR